MIKKILEFAKKSWPALALTGLSMLAYACMVSVEWRYGTLRAAYTPQTIAWYLLAFLAYLGMVVWSERHPVSTNLLWGGAILFRIMLLFTTPTLSDDVYRYVWDGYVANEGVSPYAHAIDSPELDYLDIPQRALANNAWMASPYLPAAQVVFWGVTAVFPLQPIYLQTAMVIFELGAAWLLARLLTLALLPAHRLLIYLWNPLVIVEVAHGGHVDAWMLLLAVGAVYWGVKQQLTVNNEPLKISSRNKRSVESKHLDGTGIRWVFSPLLLGLGTLTKLLPALLLPVLFWLWSWRQRVFYGLVVVLLLIPFGLQAGWGLTGELDGKGLFGALRIYSSQWNFNSGPFHWLEVWLGQQGIAEPLMLAKGVVTVLLLILLTAVWLLARTRKQPRPALRLMSLPLMGYVLLTPTLHPWYILILLAFLPFLTPGEDESSRLWLLVAPWIYFSGALVFSYLTYVDPLDFGELEWVRQLEWVPMLLILVIGTVVFLLLRWQSLKEESP